MRFKEISRKFYNVTYYFIIVLATLFTFLQSKKAYSQRTKFDSIFYHTAVNISGTDTNRALQIADSLYINTPDKINSIRALMLTANIYSKRGEIFNSINFALKADSIAEESNNHEWVARIAGFLSTQYRTSGLKNSGLNFLAKGREASRKIPDGNQNIQFQGLSYQEEAYYHMGDEDYRKAIKSLTQGDRLFKKLINDKTKFFLLATNEEMLGKNNFLLSELQLAKKHYKQGLIYIDKASGGESALIGFIYDGLGKVYFQEKEYEQAHLYLLKAVEIADRADFVALKVEVYKDLLDYYEFFEDNTNYKRFNALYKKAIEEQMNENKKSADEIISTLNTQAVKSSSNQKNYFYSFAFITICLIFLFMIYRRKKNIEKKKFERLVKILKEKSVEKNLDLELKSVVKIKKSENVEKENSSIMSVEMEQILLKKLDAFELENNFTANNISISSLATILGTNSKYISYIINHHKGKDFSSYINELRVFYIINRIENDPLYGQYKISYLAEEAGFSSHSKFSSIFKQVTQLSPSAFLEQVNIANKKAKIT
ncbi:helix-turn-helix domain-containing protein [Flavobacterium antarcticum]|uniref:helix-turn-helix domain-containing protein n=1 Tax=Flavobacterium antarcticum TaxID=271155 RepID=UPI0003B67335|nr:helix-turn-helix domain-containing protein [Flavobacterium antarcticum]